MVDSRLRRLEREAARGAPDVAERLLRERLRAGALSEERLSLAGYLGHAEARRLSVHVPATAAPDPGCVPGWGWVLGLKAWGPEVLVRGALAAASHVLGLASDGAQNEAAATLRDATTVLECPCEAHRARLLEAVRRCEAASARARTKSASDAAASAEWAGWAALANPSFAQVPATTLPVESAAQWSAVAAADALAARRGGATLLETSTVERAEVRGAIQRALLEWALGAPTS